MIKGTIIPPPAELLAASLSTICGVIWLPSPSARAGAVAMQAHVARINVILVISLASEICMFSIWKHNTGYHHSNSRIRRGLGQAPWFRTRHRQRPAKWPARSPRSTHPRWTNLLLPRRQPRRALPQDPPARMLKRALRPVKMLHLDISKLFPKQVSHCALFSGFVRLASTYGWPDRPRGSIM